MASIPEEFARAYAKAAAGKTDVVSASVANKRYIEARKLDGSLGLDDFLADTAALARERGQKAEVGIKVNGVPRSLEDVHGDLIRRAAPAEICSLETFQRKLVGLGQRWVEVGLLDDLMPLALKGSSSGASQWAVRPIRAQTPTGWVDFPNGERLRASLESCTLGKRAFSDRLDALRSQKGLDEKGVLSISAAELDELVSERSDKASLEDFRLLVSSHLTAFDGAFLGLEGGAETSDIGEAYKDYSNQRSKAIFSCQADSSHGAYSRDFSKIGKLGCPACGDERGRASRRVPEQEHQLRRRDRESLVKQISDLSAGWIRPAGGLVSGAPEDMSIQMSVVPMLRESIVTVREGQAWSLRTLKASLASSNSKAPEGLVDATLEIWARLAGRGG